MNEQQTGRPRKPPEERLVVRTLAINPQDDEFLRSMSWGKGAALARNAISAAVARERKKRQASEN